MVADFILSNFSWDVPKLEDVFVKEDVQIINAIPISHTHEKDVLIWHYSADGCYNVKSGYSTLGFNQKFIAGSSNSNPFSFCWNSLWKLNLHNKIKIFLWRALKDSIPTYQNLIQRGINCNTLCFAFLSSFQGNLDEVAP